MIVKKTKKSIEAELLSVINEAQLEAKMKNKKPDKSRRVEAPTIIAPSDCPVFRMISKPDMPLDHEKMLEILLTKKFRIEDQIIGKHHTHTSDRAPYKTYRLSHPYLECIHNNEYEVNLLLYIPRENISAITLSIMPYLIGSEDYLLINDPRFTTSISRALTNGLQIFESEIMKLFTSLNLLIELIGQLKSVKLDKNQQALLAQNAANRRIQSAVKKNFKVTNCDLLLKANSRMDINNSLWTLLKVVNENLNTEKNHKRLEYYVDDKMSRIYSPLDSYMYLSKLKLDLYDIALDAAKAEAPKTKQLAKPVKKAAKSK